MIYTIRMIFFYENYWGGTISTPQNLCLCHTLALKKRSSLKLLTILPRNHSVICSFLGIPALKTPYTLQFSFSSLPGTPSLPPPPQESSDFFTSLPTYGIKIWHLGREFPLVRESLLLYCYQILSRIANPYHRPLSASIKF